MTRRTVATLASEVKGLRQRVALLETSYRLLSQRLIEKTTEYERRIAELEKINGKATGLSRLQNE